MAGGYWAEPPFRREQMALFSPTLDASVAEDHPVRLLDEILAKCDWSSWEAAYDGKRGQPPIHPRILAGVILYGMMKGIRSSRMLEYMINNCIDFMWLAQGHAPDHSTLSIFRKKFKDPLKSLFRQTNQIAMSLGLILLKHVALDGTRIKANNGRYNTATTESLEKELNELAEKLLNELDTNDEVHEEVFGDDSLSHLPQDLADLKARQRKLEELLKKTQAGDEARRREGINPKTKPAQVPVADPDSKVLPNKEGGYAPNYTPMAAVDVHSGFILDVDVINSTSEQLVTVPAIDRIEEMLGRRPEALLADGVHATGTNFEELENRNIEFYSYVKSREAGAVNPAVRDDPTKPISEELRDQLPINPHSHKLDKSAFVYDEQNNRYYCPQGHVLEYAETKWKHKNAMGEPVVSDVYRCRECAGCPLAEKCLSGSAKKGRTVSRDKHEAHRQRFAQKMAEPEAKAIYKQRLHAAETPFGFIKRCMNVRQFLLRGLEAVTTEWTWVGTAYNTAKLIREIAKMRADLSKRSVVVEN